RRKIAAPGIIGCRLADSRPALRAEQNNSRSDFPSLAGRGEGAQGTSQHARERKTCGPSQKLSATRNAGVPPVGCVGLHAPILNQDLKYETGQQPRPKLLYDK